MNERLLYIVLHGDFPGDPLTPRIEVNIGWMPYEGKDTYSDLLKSTIDNVKANPEQVGTPEKLSRVIFYPNTSLNCYSLAGQELLWLAGMAPHPNDPNWMGQEKH